MLAGLSGAFQQCPCAAWELSQQRARVQQQPGNVLQGWGGSELEQGTARAASSKQWPEQREAVAALKDKNDPWPWEDTGELILEMLNEKILL